VIRTENLVIATGSSPAELPFLPFGGKVISSTEALSLQEVPETMAVIGGGYIGLELGTVYAKLGTKVTVIEAEKNILSMYDKELTRPVQKRLESLGVEIMTDTKAKALDEGELVVEDAKGNLKRLDVDKILVTIGRTPRTKGFGLGGLGLDMEGPFVHIDDKCRTSMRGVYAIGDITGEPMLAHRAMAQGEMLAEIIAGEKRVWDKVCVPAVCFTDPEIVSVGLTPDQAKEQGLDVKIGSFQLQANGRTMTMEGVNGTIRVVAKRDNHLVVGIQAVGTGVSEMSAGFALALEMGARLEDLAETIHAHPTQSEGVQEAAMKALGAAIHA
jgi:dihydrolipoamide dehydrogenase